jgi:hypothetical protein
VVLSGLDRPPSIATEVASDFLKVRFFRTSLSCERLSPELSFLWLSFSMLEAFCGCSLSWDWSILDYFGRTQVHFSLFILIALKKSPPFVRKQACTPLPTFRPRHPGSALKLRRVRGPGTRNEICTIPHVRVGTERPTARGRSCRADGRFVLPACRFGRASGMTR